jgi:hypothetical protein
MSAGIMNSSSDVKGGKMGATPRSDKAGLLPAREPVKGGIRKGNLPAAEPKSPGGKKMPIKPQNFNKGSQGR